MIFQMRLPAGANQRFSTDAFDSVLNKPISIKGGGKGTIAKAEVINDGAEVLLTISANADEHSDFFTDDNFFSFKEPFQIKLKEK